MVKIDAFNGITYNQDKVSSINNVIAPPYDVISPKYQETLYNRDSYNVVRLILGRIFNDDTDENSRYTRTAADYKQWLADGVLVKSDKPEIYYYIEQYKDSKGIEVNRKGFIARCYLEEFSSGKVLPHEETMGGPKEDRFNLMKSTETNFSQIFGIYSDAKKQVEALLDGCTTKKLIADVIDDDQVRHIFYKIDDIALIESVKSIMADKVVLIADGHHRYETALRYKQYRSELENRQGTDEKPYDYVMMYFSNIDEDGLRVYPTHRLLKVAPYASVEAFLDDLRCYFTVEEVRFNSFSDNYSLMAVQNLSEIPIGLVLKAVPGVMYLLKPDIAKVKALLNQRNVPEILANLDVAILHRLILEDLLGLDTVELKNQNNIEFIRDEAELKDKYDSNSGEMIFLLNTPDLHTIQQICVSGNRMPQKTTYFYPKLLSGLVFNPLS